MKNEIEVNLKVNDLIRVSWSAIKQKRILRFYFESDKGKKEWREIKPYMVYINDKEEIKVVGLPRDLWEVSENDRHPGQYTFKKIDLNQIEVLSETFNNPGVPRNIVAKTKTVKSSVVLFTTMKTCRKQ